MESKGNLLNSGKLISCPKCRHDNTQENADSAVIVTCASCGHSFTSNAAAARSGRKKQPTDALDIIPIRCSQCQKKFGVKARSAGKEIACPHCKTRQSAPVRGNANNILELLPPKYLVQESLELSAISPVGEFKTGIERKSTGFEIDTNTIRLPDGDGVAQVQSLTRESRDQRKRLRVAFVYLSGVIVLLVVFWWLLGRSDMETP